MPTFATAMTGFRGIGRIDQYQQHPGILGFVGDKLPELIEGPTVLGVALRLAAFRALPDARQVFHRNLPLAGACRLDDPPADDVVNRAHMPLLTARQPFQESFGSRCAFGLKRTADFGIVGAETLDLRRFIGHAIGIHRHAASAQINAQSFWRRLRGWSGAVQLHMQEERAIPTLDQRGTRTLINSVAPQETS